MIQGQGVPDLVQHQRFEMVAAPTGQPWVQVVAGLRTQDDVGARESIAGQHAPVGPHGSAEHIPEGGVRSKPAERRVLARAERQEVDLGPEAPPGIAHSLRWQLRPDAPADVHEAQHRMSLAPAVEGLLDRAEHLTASGLWLVDEVWEEFRAEVRRDGVLDAAA